MRHPKKEKARPAFRPSLQDGRLEERIVLNGAQSALVSTAAANRPLLLPQIRAAYQTQLRAATQDLRRVISAEAATLNANGQPSRQQVIDFNARVQGALNATAFRVSSLASLLPGSGQKLVPNLQSSLLGNGRGSLASRIASVNLRPMDPTSTAFLQNALVRQIDITMSGQRNQVDNFFANSGVRSRSVDQNGQTVPIRRFIAGQIVNQFSNSLGAIAQAFPNVASTSLFANGRATATPENLASFLNQGTQALGTAVYQLGSNLSLFSNGRTDLVSGLQNSIFGNGTFTPPNTGTGSIGSTGGVTPAQFSNFLNAFGGLPSSSDGFNSAVSTAFNNGFQNLGGSLNSFFNLPNTGGLSLPNQPTSVFGQTGSNFGGGFNTGFGSGAIGFGQAPSNFNSNFGTGFNNAISTVNPGFGFNVPTSVFNVPTSVFNVPPTGGSGGSLPIGGGGTTFPTGGTTGGGIFG